MKQLLVALAIWGVASSAGAVTTTQTITFGPSAADFSGTAGLPLLSYFNSDVGTLNAVQFVGSYTVNSTFVVTNAAGASGPTGGNIRVQSGGQYGSSDAAIAAVLNASVNTLDDPADGTAVSFGPTVLSPIAYDVRGNRAIYNLNPGQSTTVTSNGTGSLNITDTRAADLAAFTRGGGGTTSLLFTTLTGYVNSFSGGNVGAVQSNLLSGSLTVTYNYTASPAAATVPEPASWATMVAGFGLVGLGLRRRRRRAAFAA